MVAQEAERNEAIAPPQCTHGREEDNARQVPAGTPPQAAFQHRGIQAGERRSAEGASVQHYARIMMHQARITTLKRKTLFVLAAQGQSTQAFVTPPRATLVA